MSKIPLQQPLISLKIFGYALGSEIQIRQKCESPPGKRALIEGLSINLLYENSQFLGKRLFCEVLYV